MDFIETRQWLEKKIGENSNDEINFGNITVARGFTGELTVADGQNIFSMDRIPASVFDELSKAIKSYNDISNCKQFEIFPRSLDPDSNEGEHGL